MTSGDAFTDLFRTPSPDSDSDDNHGPSRVNLNSNAALMRELDLSWKDDRAKFVETPFSIASQRGSRSERGKPSGIPTSSVVSNIPAALDKTKPAVKEPTQPPQGSKGQWQPNQWATRNTKGSNAPRRAEATTTSLPRSNAPSRVRRPSTPPVDAPQVRYSGWYDVLGNPIPQGPPRKKGILEKAAEAEAKEAKKKAANEKRKLTRQRNAAIKKAKAAEEAAEERRKAAQDEGIRFTIPPAHAGPTKDFPILEGFERQKALPIKTKTTTSKGKSKDKISATMNFSASSSPPTRSPTSPEELDIIALFDDAVPITQRRETDTKSVMNLQRYQHEQNPSSNNVADSQLKWLVTPDNLKDGSYSQPSTITHVPSSALRDFNNQVGDSSSSTLPYSSPLPPRGRSSSQMIHPKPARTGRLGDVEYLETVVEQNDQGSDAHARAQHDQYQLQTPQASSTKVQASSSRRKGPDMVEYRKRHALPSSSLERSVIKLDDKAEKDQWTTFAPKNKKRGKSNLNTRNDDAKKKIRQQFGIAPVLFPRAQPPPTLQDKESSPPPTTSGHSRLTLFQVKPTPQEKFEADNAYTVKTNRGTQFGSAAKSVNDAEVEYVDLERFQAARPNDSQARRLTSQAYSRHPIQQRSEGTSTNRAHTTHLRHTDTSRRMNQAYHQDPSRDNSSFNPTQLPTTLQHQPIFHGLPQKRIANEEPEEDWTKAWSKSNQQVRKASTTYQCMVN